MRCVININSGNDALSGPGGRYELVRIIRQAAEHVEQFEFSSAMRLDLRDINGNRVGMLDWDVEDDQTAKDY